MPGRNVLRNCLVLACLAAASMTQVVRAQEPVYEVVFRPPGTRYRVLRRPRFEIIYQEGTGRDARRLAQVLETELDAIGARFGARPRLHLPVVLNAYDDLANGFVTAFPFKSEIEDVDFRGLSLSPRFPDWLTTVGPHELVHAVHADYQQGFGVTGLLRWFAPDLARSLNLFIPPGIAEGVAVLHESGIAPGAGRLNHSFFRMRFRAAMHGEHPWRLAQMLEVPAYSRPFDRYYLGGSHLLDYLARTDSLRGFRKATRWQYRFPFLGYGIPLWLGTGKSPARLGKEFRQAVRAQIEADLAARGPFTTPTILDSEKGRVHRRPRWLDAATVLVYVQGYHDTPGFYRIDVRTGARTPAGTQSITDDYAFSLSRDRSTVLFSRYVPDPYVPGRSVADAFELDPATGATHRLTREGRVFAPVEGTGGEVWMIGVAGSHTRWVRRDPEGRMETVSAPRDARFVYLAPSPVNDAVAVVLNIGGRKGLYLAHVPAKGPVRYDPLVGFEEGSVYDVAWSPDGRDLLFTADPDGVMNVYGMTLSTGVVYRVTNVPYGAFEPALSPDGRRLAFVTYRDERFDLAVMPFRVEERVRVVGTTPPPLPGEGVGEADGEEGEEDPLYHALQAVRPRMIYPTAHYTREHGSRDDVRLGVGIGLGIQGTDPLQQWAFSAEAYRQAGQVWGEAEVRTARWRLRPAVRLFRTPSTVLALAVDENHNTVRTVRVGRERRGMEASVRLPVTLSSNVYRTSLLVGMRGRLQEERLFDREGRALTAFDRRATLRPFLSFGYRLQANTRDLIPRSGANLQSLVEYDLSARPGSPRRALIASLGVHLPWLRRINGGLRLRAGVLSQNQGSIFNLDRFMPRGQEDVFLGQGTFVTYGLDYLQPIWFIDNGFVLVPLYFKALFFYSFAESLQPVQGAGDRLSSLGAGLGVQVRLFYLFNLELRAGWAYRPDRGSWAWITR